MVEQAPEDLGSEVRRLERLISEIRRDGDVLRRSTALLMLGAVGLLVSLSVPWLMVRPTAYTSGSPTSNTITGWADGWLMFGRALSDEPQMGESVVMVLQILVMMTLVALCLVLVLSPSTQAAMTTMILGGLASVVPGLLFIVGFSKESDVVSGSGLLMAAGSAVVVAIAAHTLHTALPRAPQPAKRSLVDLLPPITRASTPGQNDTPNS